MILYLVIDMHILLLGLKSALVHPKSSNRVASA